MNFREKVNSLISNILLENPSLFLIDLTISNNNAIRIVIDGDKGVGIEDCITISRAIEHNLDREEVDFSIEVTSFGATEPFKMERQYLKNVGRNVEILTTDGKKHEGLLKGIADEKVILETEIREPKPIGKGKITVKKELLFALNDIKETKVIIKF
ncbi:MAG: ribosome assembly cofactor RimP [Capnocytophaga sp.]|nr:ribosome assembly cofactor RimP [Capnocytophaga sp.]